MSQIVLKGIDKFYGGHGLQAVPAYIVDEAMILCEEILSDDDDRFETEFLGRKFLYARKFDGMFHREDGGIATSWKRSTINKKRHKDMRVLPYDCGVRACCSLFRTGLTQL